MSVLVFEGFLSTPEMQQLLEPASVVQTMMDFEAALARAQARCGVLPMAAAQAIASLCRVELYDVGALVDAAGPAGSLAIPVVQKLAETVALFDPVAAGFVHWGSTSQDVVDTTLVLLMRRGLRLIEDDLLALLGQLLDQAEQHQGLPLLARTLLQPAQVSSLRSRQVHWLLPLLRSAQALREAADAALQLQFGGAVGTQAALGDQAEAVSAALAAELQLPAPELSWHTQRDRMVRLGAELGILCGNLGKLARDLALLQLPEIAEFQVAPQLPAARALLAGARAAGQSVNPGANPAFHAEPWPAWMPSSALELGRKGGASPVMPHRNNPVALLRVLAAAERAPHRVAGLLGCMQQEFERGLGNWQAELAEASSLLLQAHGAVRALAEGLGDISPMPARMRANVEAQRGLVFAEGLSLLLAPLLGRPAAHQWVLELCARTAGAASGAAAASEPDALSDLADLAQRELSRDERLAGRLEPGQLARVFDIDAAAALADRRVERALRDARRQWTELADSPYACDLR